MCLSKGKANGHGNKNLKGALILTPTSEWDRWGGCLSSSESTMNCCRLVHRLIDTFVF